jgi:hypothetical protein
MFFISDYVNFLTVYFGITTILLLIATLIIYVGNFSNNFRAQKTWHMIKWDICFASLTAFFAGVSYVIT